MPASFMTLIPNVLNSLEAMKIPLQTSADLAETVLTVLGTDVGVVLLGSVPTPEPLKASRFYKFRYGSNDSQ